MKCLLNSSNFNQAETKEHENSEQQRYLDFKLCTGFSMNLKNLIDHETEMDARTVHMHKAQVACLAGLILKRRPLSLPHTLFTTLSTPHQYLWWFDTIANTHSQRVVPKRERGKLGRKQSRSHEFFNKHLTILIQMQLDFQFCILLK